MHRLLLPFDCKAARLINVADCEDALRIKFSWPNDPAFRRLLDRFGRKVVELGITTDAEVEKHPFTAIWLGAAACGQVAVIVLADKLYKLSEAAFLTRSAMFQLWGSAKSARLHLSPSAFYHRYPEAESEGRALLLEDRVFDVLLLRTSRAETERIASTLIDAARKAQMPLPKAEFFEQVRQQVFKVSKNEIERLWVKLAPESWRKPGPKRGRGK